MKSRYTPRAALVAFACACAIVFLTGAAGLNAGAIADQNAAEIPDPALEEALRGLAGIPAGTELLPGDLADLSGDLDLSGLDISDAGGIEYCVNVTGLDLSGNHLSALPERLINLKGLRAVDLADNRFAEFPHILTQMPQLETVIMNFNGLTGLPQELRLMANLKTLLLYGNKLDGVPEILNGMPGLEILSIGENGIKEIPGDFFIDSALKELDLGMNALTALPREIGRAAGLEALNLTGNQISALPETIADLPALTRLYVSLNALGEIPSFLLVGNIKNLSIAGNGIRELPPEMEGLSFDSLNIEWNFIDLSLGSANREILNSLRIDEANLQSLRQLCPVHILAAESGPDSVTLGWNTFASGTDLDADWSVLDFEVYDATGREPRLLDTLDESERSCTIRDLLPSTDYRLIVRVNYELRIMENPFHTRCDTVFHVSTQAADPSATRPAAAATASPASAETGSPAGNWQIAALAAICGVLAAAVIALTAVLFARRSGIR